MQKKPPPISNKRRKSRGLAVQALYQWHFGHQDLNTLKEQLYAIVIIKNIDKPYFNDLLEGTLEHLEEIDAIITPFLDRKISDLDLTELAILRYAIYELKYRKDVPPKVVINEALEITKIFGSVDGFKYVNGILDKAKDVRDSVS